MSRLVSPKGTHDLLPEELVTWHSVEQTAARIFSMAGFGEIRTPVLETTELFARGVGESTDIVNKEMYTFQKGDRSLTLRPENTAGVVRAYIQHGMDRLPKPVKLYYMGPMFRYERPQAGRQRQFHQMGVELFGLDTPQSDAEVIQLAMTLFQTLSIPNLSLELNNVGCFICRDLFKARFRALIQPSLPQLCSDCQTRYHTNPMRMLDCKQAQCQALYAQPDVSDLLASETTCMACRVHFEDLQGMLNALSIPWRQNRMLVRGLDYYTRTVFEITAADLGAQNAICGGGRYNGLVKILSGPDTPAVGWALGVERMLKLLDTKKAAPLAYYVVSDDPASALQLAAEIRQQGYSAEADLSGKAMGKQLASANQRQAQWVLILGGTERASGQVTRKNMTTGMQETVDLTDWRL
jgi:histidyl-tRNA synthetase